MKLSPTEIFEGKKIFFTSGKNYIGRNAEITMLHQPIIGLCNVSD